MALKTNPEDLLHNVSFEVNRENNTNHHPPPHEKVHQSKRDTIRRDQTYTKKYRDTLLQGSLDNVSINRYPNERSLDSTLRRSRSLAISREDIFTNLDINNTQKNRRSQLIPRAKLIDRYSSRDRLQRGYSQESIYNCDRSQLRRKSSIGVEYGITPHQICNTQRHQSLLNINCEKTQELPYRQVNQYSHDYNGEFDSLDSNLVNNTSVNNNTRNKNSHNNSYPDAGLSLPNYYPDSKCDTDLSFTDNASLNDIISYTDNVTSNRNIQQSSDNSSLQQTTLDQSENISYDDNIVFTKNVLYDKVSENNYYTSSKPRTIRGNTPYHREIDYYSGKPRSLPNYTSTATFDSDSDSISDYDPRYYDPVEKPESDNNKSESNEDNESVPHKNNTSKVITDDNEKENTYRCKSDFSNIETNPIYDEIPLITDINTFPDNITIINKRDDISIFSRCSDTNKTSIQVPAEEEEIKTESINSEEYKTIVNVTDETSNTDREDSPKETKRHSHNYLKEFLETQKGSKRPLQNFLSKKISRAFHGDKKSQNKKDTHNNLVDNQYYSLPDITISKNLQKCEKIDRKLRHCEKLTKIPPDTSANRFIVNIGHHFDVTAHSSIPVDFELKISKIPKSQKHRKQKSTTLDEREQKFLDAVKNINETINSATNEDIQSENKTVTINKINEIKVNKQEVSAEDLYQRDKEVEVFVENMSGDKEVSKEFHDKIYTMRNYWGNIVNDNREKEDPVKSDDGDKDSKKCKVIGVHTKVEDVKKMFEPQPEKIEKPSIVQKTKEIFEKKKEKRENRVSLETLIEKENQFESLNPNTIELVESNNTEVQYKKDDTLPKAKPTKLTQRMNTCPDFDHVRYRLMKSDVFQKKIFANCEKESQFDGLMQYLQDYSFQELLIDNNIVIIEPIRTNVQYVGTKKQKSTRNITQFIHKPGKSPDINETTGLRKHFFYHPIRVNREVNDDELPHPDTVKQVRQIFEGGLTRSHSSKNLEAITKQTIQYRTIDPDKDRCSATDSNSDFGSNDNIYDMCDNDICCEHYIDEEILEKIRQYGTSITYYGGRIVDKRTGKSTPMTNAIMDEIKNQKKRYVDCKCNGKTKNVTFVGNDNDVYQGIKFKLLKSNSCSSRLELVGTKNLSEYRNKFMTKQEQIIKDHKLKKQKDHDNLMNTKNAKSISNANTKNGIYLQPEDKMVINKHINHEEDNKYPKIIGEEMKHPKKLVQWGEMKDNKTYSGIVYTKAPQKINYDYPHEKLKRKVKNTDEMEFEPYEIADS